jgi:hypothetical protein
MLRQYSAFWLLDCCWNACVQSWVTSCFFFQNFCYLYKFIFLCQLNVLCALYAKTIYLQVFITELQTLNHFPKLLPLFSEKVKSLTHEREHKTEGSIANDNTWSMNTLQNNSYNISWSTLNNYIIIISGASCKYKLGEDCKTVCNIS